MPNTTSAAFKIDASPSSAGGVDVTGGQVVALQLEASPALDVGSCTYTVLRATAGAPTLSIAGGGIASPPTSAVNATVPAGKSSHSWLVLCSVSTPAGAYAFARIVARRNQTGQRKIIAGESTEYSPAEGWCESVNKLADKANQDVVQDVAYAAAITPDLSLGYSVRVGVLTGAITVNAPAAPPWDGAIVRLLTLQDVTGNRTLTFDAKYKFGGAGTPNSLNNNAKQTNSRCSYTFQYDAANDWYLCSVVSYSP